LADQTRAARCGPITLGAGAEAGVPGSEEALCQLRRWIGATCVIRADSEVLVSPSGGKLRWLIDLRSLLLKPEALELISDEFYRRFPAEDQFQFAGMEMASVPLMTALALTGARTGRRTAVAVVRKERKRTGRGRAIEGEIEGSSVTLVDDILNSGGSADSARVVLERRGVRVSRMFVIVDYRSAEGLAWRRRHGIEVHSLFSLADFGLLLKSPASSSLVRQYRPVWEFRAPGASSFHVVPKSAPLLVDGLVCFGSDSGHLWGLDAASGAVAWRFDAGVEGSKGIWSSPSHHDGRIYFGTYNGNLHCLDHSNGREVWREAACDWIGSSPLVLSRHGLLLVGLEYARERAGGSLCAMSLDSGAKVWERRLHRVQHGSAAYWQTGDLAVFGTNDCNVIALRPRTGEVAWSFDAGGPVKSAPAVDQQRGLVGCASFDGSIYVLNAANGGKVAEFRTNDACYTTPLFADGRLFCGSGDRHLYVVDLDHMALVSRFHAGARVYSSPRYLNGGVIFGCNSGTVYEIDPLSCTVTGKLRVPDATTNAIVFTPEGDRIFVPTYMNEIYAFDRV
jgi:outer membrane protein assembly factor BamB/orotate phosphoribosyltransferase